jgi:hypothetical protein
MNNLQKFGGVAAFIEAATFIVGFAMYFTLLASANYASLTTPNLWSGVAVGAAMIYAAIRLRRWKDEG